MNNSTKERAAFVTASLIELADMTESSLQETVKIVGVDAIRKLIDIALFRHEMNYEEMAEEICNVTGWEPMLVVPGRSDEALSRMGSQIADLVEGTNPIGEDAAESLYDILCWDGIWAWLGVNNGEDGLV